VGFAELPAVLGVIAELEAAQENELLSFLNFLTVQKEEHWILQKTW
jgi:hypothetical protein